MNQEALMLRNADIVEALKRDGYKFSTLIRGVVMSREFGYRRSE